MTEVLRADTPTPVTIKNRIRAFFKKNSIDISSEAIELIVALKGTDSIAVKTELEKLASFSGGEEITVRDVEEIVGRSVTESIFKLVDAINASDAGWTYRILNDLYDQKKKPHEIIGYLGWYTRIMQKIRRCSDRGIGLQGIVSELGYSSGYARRLVTQAEKYPVNRIDKWLSFLFDTDLDIKTGRKQAELAMDILLVNLLKS